MATLHLMIGLPCSAKTTLSKQLEAELPALRLNIDECHIHLFGQDAEHPDHDARHARVEAMLWPIARRALQIGMDVVLDYGLWARAERDDYRARASALGAASELHVLDVAAETLMHRLRRRNAQADNGSLIIPEASMGPWIAAFQRPDAAERVRRE